MRVVAAMECSSNLRQNAGLQANYLNVYPIISFKFKLQLTFKKNKKLLLQIAHFCSVLRLKCINLKL